MTRDLSRSEAWWRRAEQVIPLGTQTMSKSPTQWVQGVAPIFLERGAGSHVWDVDGNEWVDYPMALGPILLGHADPRVTAAVSRQLSLGITFTLPNPLEVEVAERIVAMCPGVEAVRFGKSGSDAVSAAVRAARAITGRDRIVVTGYHGWHDWYIGSTTRDRGVPQAVAALTAAAPFNDLEAMAAVLAAEPTAAVVVEPSGAAVPHPGYLPQLVELAHGHGALCIFDEVITGFRLAPGGARERYGARPDLSCYGKALGNGLPIAAVAGGWDVMRVFEDVFFSGTHGGECLALAAAATVLDVIADGAVLAEISSLGQRMLDGIDAGIRLHGVGDRVCVGGEPERAVVSTVGADSFVTKSWIQQSLLDRSCLFNGSMFICAQHTQADVDRALAAFDDAFAALAGGADVGPLLRGPAVQAVFRTP